MTVPEFVSYVAQLHTEKHNVYGDSWKRRGEAVGILANVARKVDRLGVAGAGDTSADTAVDLLVYLCKYRLWLHNELDEPAPTGFPDGVALDDGPVCVEYLLHTLTYTTAISTPELIQLDKELFEELVNAAGLSDQLRWPLVDSMINVTAPLAYELWMDEEGAQP